MTSIEFFQQAEQRLAKNPNDKQAQFIVDLWNASKTLHHKNMALRGELQAMTLRNAELSHEMDVVLSRSMAKLAPIEPGKSAEAWLAGAFATTKPMLQ